MKSFVFSNIVTTYNLQLVTTSEKTGKLKNTGKAGANESRGFEIFFERKKAGVSFIRDLRVLLIHSIQFFSGSSNL